MVSEEKQHVTQITLLTLNVWALPHISSLRRPRIAEIARLIPLLRPPPDIVALQECFTQEDFHTVRSAVSTTLPHAKFFFAGCFGSGLALLSRWPIEDSCVFPYPLNGRPTAFWRGDWYVGKGVGRARVRFGPGERDVLEVLNTHTHAPYGEETYICHRIAQAWEIAKLARLVAGAGGGLVVALGDFNMLPGSLPHRIITARSPLADVWRALHPHSSLGPATHPAEAERNLPVPTAEFNLLVNGATSDGVYNTWRWRKAARKSLAKGDPCPVDPLSPDPNAKRLDYIFASTHLPDPQSNLPALSGWVVESASVALTERHPDLNVSLSDHFGVLATLKYHTHTGGSGNSATSDDSLNSESETSRDAGDVRNLNAQLLRRPNTDHSPLPPSTYHQILSTIHSYSLRESAQQRWRAIHFHASLLLWLASLVATWFSPANYVSFILLLVSSLVLATGLVDGLLALLFFSSELRALKELEWEVRNARDLASDDS